VFFFCFLKTLLAAGLDYCSIKSVCCFLFFIFCKAIQSSRGSPRSGLASALGPPPSAASKSELEFVVLDGAKKDSGSMPVENNEEDKEHVENRSLRLSISEMSFCFFTQMQVSPFEPMARTIQLM
jgi:hypothetical protein